MSSKTKTENLQLNQWALDDVFQMSDFNSDNAKIDAAVAGALGSVSGALEEIHAAGISVVKLADLTVERTTQTVNIKMSDFVAEKKYFQYVILCPFDAMLVMSSSFPVSVFDAVTGTWVEAKSFPSATHGVLRICTDSLLNSSENYLRVFDGNSYRTNISLKNMNSISLQYPNSDQFYAGSRIIMLGLKLEA